MNYYKFTPSTITSIFQTLVYHLCLSVWRPLCIQWRLLSRSRTVCHIIYIYSLHCRPRRFSIFTPRADYRSICLIELVSGVCESVKSLPWEFALVSILYWSRVLPKSGTVFPRTCEDSGIISHPLSFEKDAEAQMDSFENSKRWLSVLPSLIVYDNESSLLMRTSCIQYVWMGD